MRIDFAVAVVANKDACLLLLGEVVVSLAFADRMQRLLKMEVARGKEVVRLEGSDCTCSGTLQLAAVVVAGYSDSWHSYAYRMLPAGLERLVVVAVVAGLERVVWKVLRLVVAVVRRVLAIDC